MGGRGKWSLLLSDDRLVWTVRVVWRTRLPDSSRRGAHRPDFPTCPSGHPTHPHLETALAVSGGFYSLPECNGVTGRRTFRCHDGRADNKTEWTGYLESCTRRSPATTERGRRPSLRFK